MFRSIESVLDLVLWVFYVRLFNWVPGGIKNKSYAPAFLCSWKHHILCTFTKGNFCFLQPTHTIALEKLPLVRNVFVVWLDSKVSWLKYWITQLFVFSISYQAMMDPDPLKRPSAREILENPIFDKLCPVSKSQSKSKQWKNLKMALVFLLLAFPGLLRVPFWDYTRLHIVPTFCKVLAI